MKMGILCAFFSLSGLVLFSGLGLCGGLDVCQKEIIPYQPGKLISIVNVTAEEVSQVLGSCCKEVTFLEAKNVSLRVPTLSLSTVLVQIFQNYNDGIQSSIVPDIIALQEGTCPDPCDTHFLPIHPLREGDDVFIRSPSLCLVFINQERMGMNFRVSKGTAARIMAVVDPKPCNENVDDKTNEKTACVPTGTFSPTSSKQSSDVLSTPPLTPSTKFIQPAVQETILNSDKFPSTTVSNMANPTVQIVANTTSKGTMSTTNGDLQTTSASVSWTNSTKNENVVATGLSKETPGTKPYSTAPSELVNPTEYVTTKTYSGFTLKTLRTTELGNNLSMQPTPLWNITLNTRTADTVGTEVTENKVEHLDSTIFRSKDEARGLLYGLYAITVLILISLVCFLPCIIHYLRRKSATDVVPAKQSIFVTRSNSVAPNLLHENWSKCNLLHQSSPKYPSTENHSSSLQTTGETASTNCSVTSQDDENEKTIYDNPDNLITRHHIERAFNSEKSSLQNEQVHEFDTQSCCDAHENKEHTECKVIYIPAQTDRHTLVNCRIQTVIEGSSTGTMDNKSDDHYPNLFNGGLANPPNLNSRLANRVNSENKVENASGVVDSIFVQRKETTPVSSTKSEIEMLGYAKVKHRF